MNVELPVHEESPVNEHVEECPVAQSLQPFVSEHIARVSAEQSQQLEEMPVLTSSHPPPISTISFFKKKRPIFTPPILKSRRCVSKVVAGKAITEPDTAIALKEYFSVSESKNKKAKFQPPIKSVNKPSKSNKLPPKSGERTPHVTPHVTSKSPVPGTSGIQKKCVNVSDSDSDESVVDDSDNCCVCGKFSPDALRALPYIEFANWGECEFDSCGHWVYLKYCCPVRVLRCHDHFFCPCHGLPWKGVEE